MSSRPSVFRPWFLAAASVFIFAGAGSVVLAQPQPPDQPGALQAATPLLSPEQLDDLVAPIALYPDPLLSQVLAASTYPLELVEAQQWLQSNRGLTGTRLMDAARQHDWDPSVQAMVAFPDVLGRLNSDIRWTTDLGNAFLAQQADVMAAVQRMRASAKARGRLYSTPQETVTTDTQNGQSAIVIEPANPEVIYVPAYDPMYVWGPPAWGYYPSLYYPAFGFGFGPGFNIGLCFGGWGFGGFGGWGAWGWGPNWFGGGIFVNHAFFRNYGFRGGGYLGGFGGGFGGRGIWSHDPAHRMGVAYPNRQLAGRFQAASRAGVANRFGGGGMAGRNAFGQAYGGNRGTFQGQTAGRQYGNRAGGQGYQSFRNSTPQGSMRNPQAGPRAAAPAYGGGARSYSGGGAPARNFNGGGGARSFGGGGTPRSFAPARSFGGGAPRSFSPARSFGGGGGGPRSFGGGAPARSFGGGGGSHFGGGGGGGHFGGGGGGGHFGGGGGGGHSGGGGGGHRR